MPKLMCPCGFVHDLSPIPDNGWQTIPDAKFDDFVTATNAHSQLYVDKVEFESNVETYQKHTKVIAENSGRLYECPDCRRLIWKKPMNSDFVVYKLEE